MCIDDSKTATEQDDITTEYVIDKAGRKTSIITNGNTVNFTYNDLYLPPSTYYTFNFNDRIYAEPYNGMIDAALAFFNMYHSVSYYTSQSIETVIYAHVDENNNRTYNFGNCKAGAQEETLDLDVPIGKILVAIACTSFATEGTITTDFQDVCNNANIYGYVAFSTNTVIMTYYEINHTSTYICDPIPLTEKEEDILSDLYNIQT